MIEVKHLKFSYGKEPLSYVGLANRIPIWAGMNSGRNWCVSILLQNPKKQHHSTLQTIRWVRNRRWGIILRLLVFSVSVRSAHHRCNRWCQKGLGRFPNEHAEAFVWTQTLLAQLHSCYMNYRTEGVKMLTPLVFCAIILKMQILCFA